MLELQRVNYNVIKQMSKIFRHNQLLIVCFEGSQHGYQSLELLMGVSTIYNSKVKYNKLIIIVLFDINFLLDRINSYTISPITIKVKKWL